VETFLSRSRDRLISIAHKFYRILLYPIYILDVCCVVYNQVSLDKVVFIDQILYFVNILQLAFLEDVDSVASSQVCIIVDDPREQHLLSTYYCQIEIWQQIS
jgi:hypothetical protein